VVYVPGLRSLFAATDFGVLKLKLGTTSWTQAGAGLPMGAVFDLRWVPGSQWLFAATHGRGAFRLNVPTPLHKLAVKRKGEGTVKSRPAGIKCGHRCTALFADGTRVTLKAKPKKHWRFFKWRGSCHGKHRTCHVTVTKNKKVKATFRKKHHN